jgi:hypothetical protein
MRRTLILLLPLALWILGCAEDPPKKPSTPTSAHKKPTEGKKVNVARNIWLEVLPDGRRQVLVSAEVILRRGHLELLLTRKHGKEHEAILAADVDARKVHEALLLTGVEPGKPARFDPEFAPASGPAIEVTLSYTLDGKEKTVRGQEWIRNQQNDKEMDCGWVFAGSILAPDLFDEKGPKRYLANDGGDLIAVVNLPSAVIDLTVRSLKNPDDRSFEAWTERVPPEGTPVVVTLTPVIKKK